jgi:carboxylate-amine ligase
VPSPFRWPFTLGIEEELFLVDAAGGLTPSAARVLAATALPRSAVDGELYSAQLELRSGRHGQVGDAVHALRRARRDVDDAGGHFIMSGLHPTASFGDSPLSDGARYARVAERFGGLLSRTPEAALQVHVGLPDESSAIRVFNGLREYMPMLSGLAANSPFWFGRDSRLSSARYAMVQAYPTRGIPPVVTSYAEYRERVEGILSSGHLPDDSYVYWDLRLRPRLGTLEVREMDAQTSIDDVAALTALIQSLCCAIAQGALGPQSLPPRDELNWSMFTAARDGTAAIVSHRGKVQPLTSWVDETVHCLKPIARELDCDDELMHVRKIVSDGGGAAAQRRTVASDGLTALVPSLIDRSRAGTS